MSTEGMRGEDMRAASLGGWWAAGRANKAGNEWPVAEKDCIYCRVIAGTPHASRCVAVERKVKIRATVDMEYSVPNFWNADQINFKFQESSWCADNLAADLSAYVARLPESECMCGRTKIEYVGEVEK